MVEELLLEKLKEVYKAHGKIVVGIDFDNTIYPLDDRFYESCLNVQRVLKKIEKYSIFCLWTVADEFTVPYKVTIAKKLYKLNIEYVNESPLDAKDIPTRKSFFNVLIDDKCGLESVLHTLELFEDWVKTIKDMKV